MKTIQLFFVSIFTLFACTDYKVEPINPNYKSETVYKSSRIATDSTPRKIFTAMISQSNGCYFTNSAMSGKTVQGVHGFDRKNLSWVDSLCYKQIETGPGLTTYKWSPLIGLAEKMKADRPNDDLYFAFMGQAGINLYYDLNPDWNSPNSTFRKYVNVLNSAISQAGPFDELIIIYVQGESDMQTEYANGYFSRERQLFDSLDVLYGVDKFLDYKVYTSALTLPIVNQAKYDVAALRNDDEVIAIPIVVSGPTALRTYPSPGEVHMTKYGVRVFVDSLFSRLK